MNAATLRDAYAQLAKRVALNPMRTCKLDTDVQEFAQASAVEQALQAFAPVLGCLTRAGAHHWITDPQQIAASRDDGTVLEADLVDAHGRGLQLRHLGGRWQLTTIRETPGEVYLADDVQLLGRKPAPAALRYRRYWALATDGGGVHPFLAMFIGADPS